MIASVGLAASTEMVTELIVTTKVAWTLEFLDPSSQSLSRVLPVLSQARTTREYDTPLSAPENAGEATLHELTWTWASAQSPGSPPQFVPPSQYWPSDWRCSRYSMRLMPLVAS